MKKQYQLPAIRVVRLQNRACLLDYSVANYREEKLTVGDTED
jgi:hypothetical protein